jgi:predicted RNA binding protein YcfA (HicA-like mRNA interferase family)
MPLATEPPAVTEANPPRPAARLPVVSAADLIRVLGSAGYVMVRQKGSHLRLRHPSGTRVPLTVPNHRELKAGLLRALLRSAGMTIGQLIRALK